jgi:hypothetical protein
MEAPMVDLDELFRKATVPKEVSAISIFYIIVTSMDCFSTLEVA